MASKFGGYAGKVIQIDLTTETAKEYHRTDRQRQLYLGGKIMANCFFAEHLTGTETPFSEEHRVILSIGPLTGTGAPGSVQFDITALSPKSGLLTSSNCGGSFGLYLKRAGYGALILTGCCKAHSWLEICQDQIRFHDADNLWFPPHRPGGQRRKGIYPAMLKAFGLQESLDINPCTEVHNCFKRRMYSTLSRLDTTISSNPSFCLPPFLEYFRTFQ